MKLVDVTAMNIPSSPTLSDETILQRNLQTLREEKNAEGRRISGVAEPIPAALVKMKWQHRREIYAY